MTFGKGKWISEKNQEIEVTDAETWEMEFQPARLPDDTTVYIDGAGCVWSMTDQLMEKVREGKGQ